MLSYLIERLFSIVLPTNLGFRRQYISKRRYQKTLQAISEPPICKKKQILKGLRTRAWFFCRNLGLVGPPLVELCELWTCSGPQFSFIVSLSCTCAYASQEVVIYGVGKKVTIAIETREQLHLRPLLADCAAIF